MVVQNVKAFLNDSKVTLAWEVIGEPIAISIQIANDNEFRTGLRTFIIPTAPAVGLDIGSGIWYFRIGSWMGSETAGKILWTLVHGPFTITSLKAPIRIPDLTFPIIHTNSIVNGFRLHTGINTKNYAVMEYSTDSKFPPGGTTTVYAQDWGRGYFDVTDLNPALTYSIRIASFMGDRTALPKETVVRLEPYRVFNGKKPTRSAKPVDETARAQSRAADPILREVANKPNAKFASHADYLRYVGAKTRADEH